MLDDQQLSMILSLDDQRPDGTSPRLIEVFDDQATGTVERLIAAIGRGDWASVTHEAHNLKGAASLYALPRLARTASRLEESGRDEDASTTVLLVQQLQRDLAEGLAALRASAATDEAG